MKCLYHHHWPSEEPILFARWVVKMGDVNTSTNTLFYLSLTLLLLLTQVWVNVLQSTTTFVCHFRPFPIIFCNVFFFGVTRARPSRQCYCFAAHDDPTSSKSFERKWDDNEWLEIARAIGIVLIFDASNCWRIPRLYTYIHMLVMGFFLLKIILSLIVLRFLMMEQQNVLPTCSWMR